MASQATTEPKPTLARNIAAARKAQGLTQRELAAKVNGVDSLAVSRWERGKAVPTPANFEALSEALSQPLAWFYTEHADVDEATGAAA